MTLGNFGKITQKFEIAPSHNYAMIKLDGSIWDKITGGYSFQGQL